jgi:sulfoxide reductase heme-binding subunit YedZ
LNPQFWWYTARAAGITAWLLLTASVMWGIVLSTDMFPKKRRPAWLLDLHRWLGGLTACFVGIHIAGLVADTYVHFGFMDIVMPFASSWKPWQVALGVLAMWGLVAVEATSLGMKWLPRKTWRAIHFTSYAVFVLAGLHSTYAGTDVHNRLYLVTTIATTALLAVGVAYRIATRNRPRRRPGKPDTPSRNPRIPASAYRKN